MNKPKVAFYWCASCGGCEEAVVDLAEGILDVVAAVDIILWPVALDYKYHHIEAMNDGEIAVSFINGAIRTEEQEHIAKLLRKKSSLVVAFGSCSSHGGIPALANLTNKEKIFKRSYHNSPSVVNPEKTEPTESSKCNGFKLSLPEFYETVYKLSDVIEVDYYLPGCAPTPNLIAKAVISILEGKLPPKGSVLSPDKSLCNSCKRNESKPDDLNINELKRITEVEADPEKCFLAQGIICMGPATRDGCEATCIEGNMPCTGCFGPTSSCRDQGAKMIATLGGIINGYSENEVDEKIKNLLDPAGTFYRYTLSDSLLGSKKTKKKTKQKRIFKWEK
jgi:F420-non-reducing hydrogenase small subunit